MGVPGIMPWSPPGRRMPPPDLLTDIAAALQRIATRLDALVGQVGALSGGVKCSAGAEADATAVLGELRCAVDAVAQGTSEAREALREPAAVPGTAGEGEDAGRGGARQRPGVAEGRGAQEVRIRVESVHWHRGHRIHRAGPGSTIRTAARTDRTPVTRRRCIPADTALAIAGGRSAAAPPPGA